MGFPSHRPRRLRSNAVVRNMVKEVRVHPSNLILPLFIVPGSGVKREISSMPGQYQLSVDMLADKALRLYEQGIQSILLFAIPETKDATGTASWATDGIIQRSIPEIKKVIPEMQIISDLCFCDYTSHGHCGIMKDGKLDNDATLEILVKQTLSHANAGIDMIAPSGMLDGAVGVMRNALDEEGFSQLPIMAYSAKMASACYGPFRDAVQSAPEYGDRKTYQMDGANLEEALREVALDVEEGADIIMVKPASLYLDVIREVKNNFSLPLAAYNVSGEYAMVKAAAAKGWLDETRIMLEMLTSIKRAGADIIITYFAEDFVRALKAGEID